MNLFVKLTVLLYTGRAGLCFRYDYPCSKIHMHSIVVLSYLRINPSTSMFNIGSNCGSYHRIYHLWTDDLKSRRKEAYVWLLREA